jgi:hypothetical protein
LHAVNETEPVEDLSKAEPEETEEEKVNREAAESIDIDSLSYESDFSIFMKTGVPELLRRKAMRKLWSSNPVLANLDGLNDYDEDYADPKFNVFKSAWNVVGGYLGENETRSGNDDSLMAEGALNSHEATEPKIDAAGENSDIEDVAYASSAGTEAQDEDEAQQGDAARDDPVPRVSLRQRLKG